jgi:hypothetical protein
MIHKILMHVLPLQSFILYIQEKMIRENKISWYDGGLLPARPDELQPGEAFGNWDGGLLFIGTKGKMLFDCYGSNPRLLPTRLMDEKRMPKQKKKEYPKAIICNG